jgi:tRNA modification GTPase
VYTRDTIAAIATPAGVGAVAIVRVSGPAAAAVARRVFRGHPPHRWRSHRLYLGRFVNAEEQDLDRGLAVMMRAPHSYTGEDVVELHCHGGTLVARRILGAVLDAGARTARAGEFTARALLNGKLDLAQAESVADLINAPTDAALRVAVDQLGGALSRKIAAIRQRLIGIGARLEVAIDFSEEDVGELDRRALTEQAAATEGELLALVASYAHGRVLREGLRVAIVGKPNVGKSSLMNHLLQADRAIVTPIPGTTRDTLEEWIELEGMPVVLVDTAGVRQADGEVERIGIERTRREIANADLAVVMLDSSHPLASEDREVLDATRHKERILLINKIDLPTQLSMSELAEDLLKASVKSSLVDGRGLDSLTQKIVASGLHGSTPNGEVVVVRERQRSALESAASAAAKVVKSLELGQPADIVAVDVMSALGHLGDVVGPTSVEDLLDRVFSEFCIGK